MFMEYLTLKSVTCKIWRAPNNASRWQMGFNSAFKGLIVCVDIYTLLMWLTIAMTIMLPFMGDLVSF